MERGQIKNIISRMNLKEKISQLCSIPSIEVRMDGSKVEIENLEEKIAWGIGSFQLPARNFPPEISARINNEIQRRVMEKSRFHIPALIQEECLSGQVAKGASMFPKPIGLACTFHTELVKQIYEAVGRETRARGGHQAFTPVLDLRRDPRFGRLEETFGEDTFLTSQMGCAAVKGLQKNVVSTVKHFAGYGQCSGGRNFAPSFVGRRELLDEILPPFRAAVVEGGAMGVMPSHCDVDGIPCHQNRELLDDILRKQWGFKGIVVSDYYDIGRLEHLHGTAESPLEAAMLALKAGVDMDIPDGKTYQSLENQLLSPDMMDCIDRAVERILCIKNELGLFEQPFVEPVQAKLTVRCESHCDLALEAAKESLVLLENDGILPLASERKSLSIAVIGPCAHPVHFSYYSSAPHIGVSILEGIRERWEGNQEIYYEEGCGLTKEAFTMETEVDATMMREPELCSLKEDRKMIRKAADCAKTADLVVLCLGGSAATSREAIYANNSSGDNDNLNLPGHQEELFKKIRKVNPNIVTVIVSGKPYSNERIYRESRAVIQCFYAGQETGRAVAALLGGDYNPSGKLCVSVARNVGQLPVYYSQKRTGQFKHYLFSEHGPLYPFGFGRSYTTYTYENLVIEKRAGTVLASVDVKNTGHMAGEEIVQLYVTDIHASVVRPAKELKGFRRVHLEPRERKCVSFSLREGDVSFTGIDGKFGFEPGEFEILMGPDSSRGLTDRFIWEKEVEETYER